MTVLILWLAACVLSSAAARQTPRLAQSSEEVQRLMSECEQQKYSSCNNLGRMIAEGRGTAKDEARAVTLFQKACDAAMRPPATT
ncbi:MAG TPA: SEL1-like repeat protein [Candidatus Acidoferrales bacterium]|nr:SEL1-like repeat protein [Candidatus Acidoferrales bacterium]